MPAEFRQRAVVTAFVSVAVTLLESVAAEAESAGIAAEDAEDAEPVAASASAGLAGSANASTGSRAAVGEWDAISLATVLDEAGLGARIEAAASAVAEKKHEAAVAVGFAAPNAVEAAHAAANKALNTCSQLSQLVALRQRELDDTLQRLDLYCSEEAKQLVRQAAERQIDLQAAVLECVTGPCRAAAALVAATQPTSDEWLAALDRNDDAACAAAVAKLQHAAAEADRHLLTASAWYGKGNAIAAGIPQLLERALALPPVPEAERAAGSGRPNRSLADIAAQLVAANAQLQEALDGMRALSAELQPLPGPVEVAATSVAQALSTYAVQAQEQQQQPQQRGGTDLPAAVLAATGSNGAGPSPSPEQQSSAAIDEALAAAREASAADVARLQAMAAELSPEEAQLVSAQLLGIVMEKLRASTTTAAAQQALGAVWQQSDAAGQEAAAEPAEQQAEQQAEAQDERLPRQ